MEFKKAIDYKITIEPSANNGFFVTVGCAGPFVYIDKKELIGDLEAYLNNPEKYEKEECQVEQPREPIGHGGSTTPNRR